MLNVKGCAGQVSHQMVQIFVEFNNLEQPMPHAEGGGDVNFASFPSEDDTSGYVMIINMDLYRLHLCDFIYPIGLLR